MQRAGLFRGAGGCREGAGDRGPEDSGVSRSCMARLLRSNIQDFVQEVPVGQMAPPPRCQGGRRGKGGG